jgi:hypothetical protein
VGTAASLRGISQRLREHDVTGALRLAERLGPNTTIVTIMCDTGMKYLKNFAQSLS